MSGPYRNFSRAGLTQSLLMDRDTLMAHRLLWGHEGQQHTGQMENLTLDERSLLEDLRANRLGDGVRMEQERIAFHCLTDQLKRLALRRNP